MFRQLPPILQDKTATRAVLDLRHYYTKIEFVIAVIAVVGTA